MEKVEKHHRTPMHIDDLHAHLWFCLVPYLVLKVSPEHTSTSFRNLANLLARQCRHDLHRLQLLLLTFRISRRPEGHLPPLIVKGALT
jgi:hypothetical protein